MSILYGFNDSKKLLSSVAQASSHQIQSDGVHYFSFFVKTFGTAFGSVVEVAPYRYRVLECLTTNSHILIR